MTETIKKNKKGQNSSFTFFCCMNANEQMKETIFMKNKRKNKTKKNNKKSRKMKKIIVILKHFCIRPQFIF